MLMLRQGPKRKDTKLGHGWGRGQGQGQFPSRQEMAAFSSSVSHMLYTQALE